MADWTYNDRELRETITKIAELTGKAMEDVIRDQTRLFVRDADAVTPPFGKSPAKEKDADKRRQGEWAVERDIKRAMFPIDNLRVYHTNTDMGRALRRATKKRDTLLVESLLRKVPKLVHFAGVLSEPDFEMHQRKRNHRGVVPKAASYFILSGKKKLQGYIRKTQKRVGLGKAGWNTPKLAMGVTPGPWLRRHYKSEGIYTEAFGGPTPATIVGNRVPHVQNSVQRINDFAWRSRIRNASKQAEHLERAARRRMRELKIA